MIFSAFTTMIEVIIAIIPSAHIFPLYILVLALIYNMLVGQKCDF